jgi:outer membrane receptor protein involved in Fe transport
MYHFRFVIYVVGLVLLAANLSAQQTKDGIVAGSIISKPANKPVEFVSISLFKANDNVSITGTMSDAEGKFFINQIPDGKYYVLANRIGYADVKSGTFTINSDHMKIDLGKLVMLVSAIPTGDITVTAEKPVSSNSIDRKVYNIDQDIMSKAGTASDLLQNVPSVSVDIDGNVSLRGSENVLILINGRSSPLMGKTRAAVLQQMPANSIERIEVITNPSAKYKPEGTSGIINIVLKKNTTAGLNGSVSLNAGLDSRYNGSVNLNYNPGRFNLFGSLGYRKDSRHRSSDSFRSSYDQNRQISSYLSENDKSHARPLSDIASLGVDYNPNENNHMGISGDYFYRDVKQLATTRDIYQGSDLAITSDFIRGRLGHEHEYENQATAYYEHSFSKEDHKLHVEYVISDRPEKEDNHYNNTYSLPAPGLHYENSVNNQGERQDQISVDYSNPISEKSTIEAGYQMELDKRDIDNYDDSSSTIGQAIVDSSKTNHFKFDQSIHALYATFGHSFGKISILGGLRYEYVQNKPFLVSNNLTIKNSYSNLYPSIHLSYALDKNSELQLSYSKRTNRPDGEDLNPFPEYRDQYNVDAGNPRLRPEYIHSVELGWQMRNDHLTITPSVYYGNQYNGFTRVTEPWRDSILITQMQNLLRDQSSGLELIVNGTVRDNLDLDVSVNTFYNTIDASNIGFSSNKSVVSWSGVFNVSYRIRPTMMLQTSSYYRSTRLTPQGKYLANFVANFGARQDLFNEKLSIILSISDLFDSRIQKTQLRTTWLDSDSKWRRDSRLAYLGVMYHFGKSAKKNAKKTIEFDDNQ